MDDVTTFIVVAAFFWISGYRAGRAHYLGTLGGICDLPPGTYRKTSNPISKEDEGYVVTGKNGGRYGVVAKDGLPQGWWKRACNFTRFWHAKTLPAEIEVD